MDPYSAQVIASIEPNIRASFSETQLRGIQDALDGYEAGRRRHWIDVRGRIPAYFASYYFVFLMGRDRRIGRRRTEYKRRGAVSMLGNVLFFMLVMSPLILLALVGLYFLKAALGIDLFPDSHLPSLLGLDKW